MQTQDGNPLGASAAPPLTAGGKPPINPAKSRTTGAPPVAKPVAAAPAADGEMGEPRRHWSAAFWQRSSGVLISMIVHLIVLLLLALATVVLEGGSVDRLLTAAIDSGEELAPEEITIDVPMDDLDDIEALPVQLEDPGLARFGDVVSAATAADVGDVGSIQTSDVLGEIGLLTGGEGDGFASDGKGKGGAAFFGVKAGGNKFVFCVDGSKSMNRNGWERCRQELIDSVNRLNPKQRFYVILFADKDYRMFGPKDEAPGLMAPTYENKARLRQWLYDFELVLGTKPLSSIKFAFKMKPDAIYLLTDGQFHDATEAFLEKSNHREDAYDGIVPRVLVHTIGFTSNRGEELLTRIAKDNGGTYRFVPGQPKPRPKRKRPGRPGGNMRMR